MITAEIIIKIRKVVKHGGSIELKGKLSSIGTNVLIVLTRDAHKKDNLNMKITDATGRMQNGIMVDYLKESSLFNKVSDQARVEKFKEQINAMQIAFDSLELSGNQSTLTSNDANANAETYLPSYAQLLERAQNEGASPPNYTHAQASHASNGTFNPESMSKDGLKKMISNLIRALKGTQEGSQPYVFDLNLTQDITAKLAFTGSFFSTRKVHLEFYLRTGNKALILSQDCTNIHDPNEARMNPDFSYMSKMHAVLLQSSYDAWEQKSNSAVLRLSIDQIKALNQSFNWLLDSLTQGSFSIKKVNFYIPTARR